MPPDTPHTTSHAPSIAPHPSHLATRTHSRLSVLAWPAWRRVLVVLPAVVLLWLAVAWANLAVVP